MKRKKYGDGGTPTHPLWDSNRKAFVDSTLGANKNLDWVQRLYEKNAPSVQIPGQQYRSTHFMSDNGQGYVFPGVARQNGKLGYLGGEDQAEQYARSTNTGIQFKTPEQGSWFASNGYKVGTGVNNSINPQGMPYNNPNYQIQQRYGGVTLRQRYNDSLFLGIPDMNKRKGGLFPYKKGGFNRYDWGGFSDLKTDPTTQIPGMLPPGHMGMTQDTLVYPSMNGQQSQQTPQWQSREVPTFDINYNHIAASNTLKAGIGYLAQRKKRADFNEYNREQSNPLLQLPYTPNTSQQQRFGMDYSRYGGIYKDGTGKDYYANGGLLYRDSTFTPGKGWDYYDGGGDTPTGGPNQQGPTKPTTADSLALYNNSIALQKYYNSRGYVNDNSPIIINDKLGFSSKSFDNKQNQAVSFIKNTIQSKSGYPNTNRGKDDSKISMDDYYKKVNDNQYYQRDQANSILDLRSPMGLYDKRIPPQSIQGYGNKNKNDQMYGDLVQIGMYDPIAVKPWNMLTDNERAQRIQKYGYPDGQQPQQQNKQSQDKYGNTVVQDSPNSFTIAFRKQAPPPKPYGNAKVSPVEQQQGNINVQPQAFNMPQMVDPGLKYNEISPGPYDPRKGSSVYKDNKLVGYADDKGNPVDASYFGIIDPSKKAMGGMMPSMIGTIPKKKKDDGGYIDFDQDFDRELTEDTPVAATKPVEQEEEPKEAPEEVSTSTKDIDEGDTSIPFKSSAERLAYLMTDDSNAPQGVNVDNPYDNSKSSPSFAQSIADRESNGKYTAFNPQGGGEGAVGKYQFRWNLHKDDIRSVTGVKSKEDFLNNPYAQEKYFKNWDEKVLTPAANNLLPIAQLKNSNITLDDVKRQIHFAGPAGAAKYYKQGIITKDANGTTNETYKEGGEYNLEEDQIQELIRKGYKITRL